MDSTYLIISCLLTSFAITYFGIPSIIEIAELKHLFDTPDSRKNHKKAIPTLGGLAIFAGFVFSVTFWSTQKNIVELQYIISSVIILFFTGVKDDIINIIHYKKLFAQLLVAVILVYFGDIRLTSLYGLFEIYDIPYAASFTLSIIAIIGITNSFNLIDGIDTLAASTGILATLVFGLWFHLTGFTQYAILSFSLLGALSAFYFFNRTPAKIFMGDTGSLLLGMVCSVLAIKFIEFNRLRLELPLFNVTSAPAVATSILIIPLADTLRVFAIRLLRGKSPFHPDRNHIHHILTDLGLSHLKATYLLLIFNVIIVMFNFYFQKLPGELLLTINIIYAFAFSSFFTRKRNLNIVEKVKILKKV